MQFVDRQLADWKHNNECVTKDFTLEEKGFKSACRWVDRNRVEYVEKCLKDILY